MANEFINPTDHRPFLGTSFVNRQEEIVLRIGTKQWTRTQLVQHIGIGNIAAAGKLSTVLRKAGVKNIEQLYTLDPRELSLIKGLGETTIYVAMAVLHIEGFNAAQWYKEAVGAQRRAVTFRTMKIRSKKRGKR